MEQLNIFEKASRLKLRFPSVIGASSLSVEDLWDLPFKTDRPNKPSLNNVANTVYAATKEHEEDFFSETNNKVNSEDNLRLDIIKRIISVRQEENKVKAQAAEAKSFNAKIDALIEQKTDQELAAKSVEELIKMKK